MTIHINSDAASPIACSLQPGEQELRAQEFSILMKQSLLARESSGAGILLRFRSSPEIRATVEDLIRREHACCPFLGFDLSVHEDELWLQVFAPVEAHGILKRLFAL